MTTPALITMITSWAIIFFFTSRFFMKVMRTPQEKEAPDEEGNTN